jgi:hypothetical protein
MLAGAAAEEDSDALLFCHAPFSVR